MAVIYLINAQGGCKVATSDLEAKYDEARGWRRFDPAAPEPRNAMARHPLDHDGDGRKGGSEAPEGDVKALRADYQEKFGKRPFPGWDADTLREKLA